MNKFQKIVDNIGTFWFDNIFPAIALLFFILGTLLVTGFIIAICIGIIKIIL